MIIYKTFNLQSLGLYRKLTAKPVTVSWHSETLCSGCYQKTHVQLIELNRIDRNKNQFPKIVLVAVSTVFMKPKLNDTLGVENEYTKFRYLPCPLTVKKDYLTSLVVD